MLALAYVLELLGSDRCHGYLLRDSAPVYAILAPALGWIGTAVTGSDTSANALFSKLQVSAAENLHQAGISGATPELLLAANTTGGVVGKMISRSPWLSRQPPVDMKVGIPHSKGRGSLVVRHARGGLYSGLPADQRALVPDSQPVRCIQTHKPRWGGVLHGYPARALSLTIHSRAPGTLPPA